MKLIDKAAVVAEIEKLIRENELYLSENASDVVRFQKTSTYSVLNKLLHFIDTLEVTYKDGVDVDSVVIFKDKDK